MAQDSHRDHREFHQQQANAYNLAHANHESLHSFLFFFLITFLILSQVGLFLWKKYRYRSFQNTTLLGLWLIPFVFSCYFLFYRMLFVWTLFSAVTFYILAAASKSPLAKETPRQVYQWFYWVYRVCASMAFFGYCLFMLDFLGISRAVTTALFDQPFMLSYFGWMCIFYGLYYGVLGRDCAEMCTDRLASSMGFTGKGLPKKQLLPHQCCICGGAYSSDNSAQLNCGHQFHEFCIRGWTMIGKKDTCPYCSEKVSLKQVFKNPWEKQGILWAHLMDALRYLIVWNPIILFAVQGFLYFVDPGA